jgi:hypothetical protein
MAYWWLLFPVHQIAFRAMVHHRVVRARRMAKRMARTPTGPPSQRLPEDPPLG